MSVHSIWSVLNLAGTPFFQDTLDPSEAARYPIDLFVGRENEATRILREIASKPHSRHAIQAAPGIGKSTLAQWVKHAAAQQGFLTSPATAAVGHADSTEVVLLRILDYAFEAVIADGGIAVATTDVMQDARQVLHAYRTRSGGFSWGFPGGPSAGLSTGVQHVTPPDAAPVYLPRLLRKLGDFIQEKLRRPGLVVHLNDLENLAEADAQKAAAIVRDLRDQGLMYEGFHYLVVGTDDAIATVTGSAQVRSVFTHHPLQPLSPEEVVRLLEKRYHHLALDPERPVHPPVESPTVLAMYQLFRGDLRGMLRALEIAAIDLVGLGPDPSAPMNPADMQAVLRQRYEAEMQQRLSDTQMEYLRLVADADPEAGYTQQDFVDLWDISQPAVSTALAEFQKEGLITAGERLPSERGRPRQLYRLTGAARLVFGGFAAT